MSSGKTLFQKAPSHSKRPLYQWREICWSCYYRWCYI